MQRSLRNILMPIILFKEFHSVIDQAFPISLNWITNDIFISHIHIKVRIYLNVKVVNILLKSEALEVIYYIIVFVYDLVLNSSWRNIGNVETVFLRIQVNFLCEVHPSNLLFQSCHVKIVGFELKIIPITEISTIFILNYYNKSYQFNGSHYSVFSIVRPPIVRGFVRVCIYLYVCICVRT